MLTSNQVTIIEEMRREAEAMMAQLQKSLKFTNTRGPDGMIEGATLLSLLNSVHTLMGLVVTTHEYYHGETKDMILHSRPKGLSLIDGFLGNDPSRYVHVEAPVQRRNLPPELHFIETQPGPAVFWPEQLKKMDFGRQFRPGSEPLGTPIIYEYFLLALDRKTGEPIGASPAPEGTAHIKINVKPLAFVLSFVGGTGLLTDTAYSVADDMARAFIADVYMRKEGDKEWKRVAQGKFWLGSTSQWADSPERPTETTVPPLAVEKQGPSNEDLVYSEVAKAYHAPNDKPFDCPCGTPTFLRPDGKIYRHMNFAHAICAWSWQLPDEHGPEETVKCIFNGQGDYISEYRMGHDVLAHGNFVKEIPLAWLDEVKSGKVRVDANGRRHEKDVPNIPGPFERFGGPHE